MLRLELLDALELGDAESAVFALPVVVGGLADAVLAADVGDLHAGVGLLEDGHDLALGESAFLHRLGVVVRPEPSTFDLFLNRGRLHSRFTSVSTSGPPPFSWPS